MSVKNAICNALANASGPLTTQQIALQIDCNRYQTVASCLSRMAAHGLIKVERIPINRGKGPGGASFQYLWSKGNG